MLRANPNHAGGGWDDQPEEDDSEAEVDDVETLIAGVEKTNLNA